MGGARGRPVHGHGPKSGLLLLFFLIQRWGGPWWCCTRACERKHRVKKVANIALTLVDVKAPLGHVTHTPLQLLGGESVEVVDKRSLVRDLKVTNAAVTLPTKVNPVAGVHFMERGVLENAIGKSTLLGHQGVLVEVGALRSLLGGGGGGGFGHADGLHVVGDVRDVVVQLVGRGPKSGLKKKFKGPRGVHGGVHQGGFLKIPLKKYTSVWPHLHWQPHPVGIRLV